MPLQPLPWTGPKAGSDKGQRSESKVSNMCPSSPSPHNGTWAEIPPVLSTDVPPVPLTLRKTKNLGELWWLVSRPYHWTPKWRGILRCHLQRPASSLGCVIWILCLKMAWPGLAVFLISLAPRRAGNKNNMLSSCFVTSQHFTVPGQLGAQNPLWDTKQQAWEKAPSSQRVPSHFQKGPQGAKGPPYPRNH